MLPGFNIKAFKLGAAFRTINRFRACHSNDWKRFTRLSLKSFSVSRQANDLIIYATYYAKRNMSSVICQAEFNLLNCYDHIEK